MGRVAASLLDLHGCAKVSLWYLLEDMLESRYSLQLFHILRLFLQGMVFSCYMVKSTLPFLEWYFTHSERFSSWAMYICPCTTFSDLVASARIYECQ